jgi:hypothetical protein
MITFERMSVWGWIQGWLFLRRRAYKRQLKLRAAIQYLVEHPEEPCSIDGIIVRDGYGRETK